MPKGVYERTEANTRKSMYHKFDLLKNCPNPRNNPGCHLLQFYSSNKEKRLAEAERRVCASCRKYRIDKSIVPTRVCPNPQGNKNCYGIIEYYSRGEMFRCARRNAVCKACSHFGFKMPSEGKRKISESAKERYKDKTRCPMYGKHLSEEAKAKLRATSTKQMQNRPPEMKRAFAMNWVGKKHTEATKRKMSLTQKMNPRPPVATAGGWAIGGRYKGRYFRSSCELRFLIERGGERNWISGESKKFRIPYVDRNGVRRFYYPDLIDLDGGLLVEIKPKGWQQYQVSAVAKVEAGRVFCETCELTFLVVEMDPIPKKQIFDMRERGEIELNGRWERQYQEWRARINA